MNIDQVLSYREMCDAENKQTLQRGMNFRTNPRYSVVLMSRRSNAPYVDQISSDGREIEYEGHDALKTQTIHPKQIDQPAITFSGRKTENGKFIEAIELFKYKQRPAEPIKVYEKILPGVWSFKGMFSLVDYKTVHDGRRNVFRFILRFSEQQKMKAEDIPIDLAHTRIIPTEVKQAVYKRDGGKCVICGEVKNIHFDHDLPFAKGGTSLTEANVRLLCMKHNLQKSDNIQ